MSAPNPEKPWWPKRWSRWEPANEFPQFPQALGQSGQGANVGHRWKPARGFRSFRKRYANYGGLTSRRSDGCAFSARPRPSRRTSSRETWLAPRMRIEASTRRAFRRRLPAPPPSPRRALDDRAVFVDSGSSAEHGDAPRCGSAAYVSHAGAPSQVVFKTIRVPEFLRTMSRRNSTRRASSACISGTTRPFARCVAPPARLRASKVMLSNTF